MQLHIGTKMVTAQPMTRRAYNGYRGWTLPADEDETNEGYLVKDLTTKHIHWQPAAVFTASYRPTAGMTFGFAIEALKAGKRVARVGWDGKGMWLKLIPNSLADCVAFQHEALNPLPWIGMKTADECFVPWLASQTDMLADDWHIAE